MTETIEVKYSGGGGEDGEPVDITDVLLGRHVNWLLLFQSSSHKIEENILFTVQL